MYQQVRAYVKEHHMLGQSDRVVAGISGGADSICLLFILMKLKEELGFSIVGVHVNHGLRGAEADKDERYVHKICKENKITLEVYRVDVRDFAKRNKFSEEEAGRALRRDAFLRACEKFHGTKIALAHHMNDNAETFLFNLCRGTGIKGMGGIAPVSGRWIRPLLCVKRQDIESYLNEMGIHYCTDKTNLEDGHTRNRLRHHVVPYLEQQINGRAVDHIADAVSQVLELNDFLEGQTVQYLNSCVRQDEDKTIILEEAFIRMPEVMKSYVLHEILCREAGQRKDIEAAHIRALKDMMAKQVGKQACLPYSIRARRCYEGIALSKGYPPPLKEERPPISMRVIPAGKCDLTLPDSPYTKWFNYDIIKSTVKIRHREPGDFITIDGCGNTQKLKKYFVNEKIPQEQRDKIWLVADGQHIIWIVGYRQNQKYRVTEQTKQILVAELDGGENYGGDD